jgi:hypothetical protein
MSVLNLSPEVIEMAKREVAIEQYFTLAEDATPKHILFKEFVEKSKWKGLPKIIFYILMDELYPIKKASDGNLGYCVTFNSTPTPTLS